MSIGMSALLTATMVGAASPSQAAQPQDQDRSLAPAPVAAYEHALARLMLKDVEHA